MMYVSRKYQHLFIAGLAVLMTALTGCEDPAVEVGTLGKKLSAPAINSASPFDQDFDTNQYVHVTGTCDSRVGDLSVSFNLISKNSTATTNGGTTASGPTAAQIAAAAVFHSPPSTSDITGTTLTTAPTNDINCADGVFNFYLTKADMYSIWGFDASTTSGIDVSQIAMKGSTLIGDTQTLTLVNSNTGNGGSVASKVVIEKQWPRGFAGSGHCEAFNIYLTDGSGNSASSSTAVSVNLTETIAGASSTGFAYTTWDSCNQSYSTTNPVAGVSSFTIPAGQNSLQIMIPMPADSGSFDKTFGFSVTSGNLASGTQDTLVLRDSSSTARRWVAMDPNGGSRFLKNLCYPISFNRYLYSGSADTATASLNVTPTSANTKLKFYSDATCSTGVTSFTIPTSSSSVTGYVRYNADSTETTDSKIIVSLGSSDSTYDFAPFIADIDAHGIATPSRVSLWGPNEINRSTCTAFKAVIQNSNSTPVPASANTTISLASTAPGSFYLDSSCASTNVTSTTIDQGNIFSGYIFFKGVAATTAGSYTMTVSATGMTAGSQTLNVTAPVADHVSLNPTVTPVKNTCIPVTIYPMDSLGIVTASGNLNYTYVINGSYASTTRFYSDNICSVEAGSSSTGVLPSVGGTYTVYLKSSTPESVTTFVFNTTFSNGVTATSNLNITWQ